MKALYKPTRKDVERVADECSREIIECLESENAINIIATARFFGLGEKRIKKYIEFLAEVKKEFRGYHKDGIDVEKISEEIEYLGLDTAVIYEKPESIRECLRQIKADKKPNLTLRQAKELTEKMNGFKEFMEVKENGQN